MEVTGPWPLVLEAEFEGDFGPLPRWLSSFDNRARKGKVPPNLVRDQLLASIHRRGREPVPPSEARQGLLHTQATVHPRRALRKPFIFNTGPIRF